MSSSLLILIPAFNDWKTLDILINYLDKALRAEAGLLATILIVDDASTSSPHDDFLSKPFKVIDEINILKLRRNLGHQRAIAVGIAYVEEHLSCQAVVVMDGDGEDDPFDVPKLVRECKAKDFNKIIFAKRSQRSESWVFRLFYLIYKVLYRLLTGQEISMGNFSIIPYKLLSRLVVVSEIWNHYAAGIMKSRLPYAKISTIRKYRLYGHSKMNFVSLVVHGLSAISVHGDTVGVRLLVASCLLILIDIFLIIMVLAIKLATNLAIPGWTSYLIALLFIVFVQVVMLSLVFVFVVLIGRNNYSFLPQRDYHYFVLNLQKVFPNL